MSIDTFPELSALRVELAPHIRDRHLVEIVRAVRGEAVGRKAPAGISWRRWVGSLAATLTLLTPVAAAAADGAMPDDTLYPLKRALETIVRLVDRDVVAEHRIEELESLVTDDPTSPTVADLLPEARRAVRGIDSPQLVIRLAVIEVIVDQAWATAAPLDAAESADATSSDRPVDGEPVDEKRVDGEAVDDERVEDASRSDDETRTDEETTPTAATDAPVDNAPAPTISDAPPFTEAPRDGRSDPSEEGAEDRPGGEAAEAPAPAGDGDTPAGTGADNDPPRDLNDQTP